MKFSSLLAVYVALVILLGVTVAITYSPIAIAIKPALGLTIAAAKAALIALFFMNIHRESGVVRIFAVAGAFWLLLFFILTFGDYLTR